MSESTFEKDVEKIDEEFGAGTFEKVSQECENLQPGIRGFMKLAMQYGLSDFDAHMYTDVQMVRFIATKRREQQAV